MQFDDSTLNEVSAGIQNKALGRQFTDVLHHQENILAFITLCLTHNNKIPKGYQMEDILLSTDKLRVCLRCIKYLHLVLPRKTTTFSQKNKKAIDKTTKSANDNLLCIKWSLERTLERIYCFPGIQETFNNVCTSCLVCQRLANLLN